MSMAELFLHRQTAGRGRHRAVSASHRCGIPPRGFYGAPPDAPDSYNERRISRHVSSICYIRPFTICRKTRWAFSFAAMKIWFRSIS